MGMCTIMLCWVPHWVFPSRCTWAILNFSIQRRGPAAPQVRCVLHINRPVSLRDTASAFNTALCYCQNTEALYQCKTNTGRSVELEQLMCILIANGGLGCSGVFSRASRSAQLNCTALNFTTPCHQTNMARWLSAYLDPFAFTHEFVYLFTLLFSQ